MATARVRAISINFHTIVVVVLFCLVFLNIIPDETNTISVISKHDDVIKWKHFPRYWPLQSQWRGALMLTLICAWTNGCPNNRYACDLRRHRAHHDVTVMKLIKLPWSERLLRAVVVVRRSHAMLMCGWGVSGSILFRYRVFHISQQDTEDTDKHITVTS